MLLLLLLTLVVRNFTTLRAYYTSRQNKSLLILWFAQFMDNFSTSFRLRRQETTSISKEGVPSLPVYKIKVDCLSLDFRFALLFFGRAGRGQHAVRLRD